ncbi:hypothetical protein B0H67DRAFT_549439 [Lasiosphaeris hirsuta]|uniref:Uncharacterized protein n=1 Tax=Lasiosphaeris hirsuta TaxID=260670 RepID=A0AA40E9F8_9PEZI|nr:hypothetical protein B0H67DRAFT_549439 [Lasiosphaeris hirsuta]
MSFVLRRLAPAVLIVSLLAGAGHVSALPDARKSSNLGAVIDNADTVFLSNWVAPVPGTRAYVGHQERGKIDIGRRDCLPNGTNYCFGDTVNFCFNCGTCCVDGIYCCGAGGICCGTGCCASGQTCDDGQCKSSVNAVTVTSIAYETVTRTATQVATILLVIVDTSTIVATSDVTVSNQATQTNVVWTTTTVFEAETTPGSVRIRAVDNAPPEPRSAWKRALSAAWTSLTTKDVVVDARSPNVVRDRIVRRQATKEPGSVAAASTVTQFNTQTVEITSVISVTITTSTTSFVMKTVVITNTRVFNAQATTETTSTLTIISRQPKTEFITTTATPIRPGTATLSEPTSSSTGSGAPVVPANASKSVSTGAIAGAAVGGTVFAIIIAAIVIFFIRHRRSKQKPFDNDIVLPPDALDMNNGGGMDMRQPTYPAVLPHFATTPAHHAAQFQPPNNLSPNANTYLDPSSAGAAAAPQHRRTSSGYSTLVGTPNLGAGGKKDDRLSAMTMASGTTSATTPPLATTPEAVEAPTEPPTRWFEVDGNNQINEADDGHHLVDPAVDGGHSSPVGTGSPPLPQQQTPPQHLRQNSNSSSTYSAYGGHDVQSISGAYFQGSVGQAVEMGPGEQGGVQQQYGQQYQQLAPEQQAYHEQAQQQGYVQQYYHMQPNQDPGR